ncbi:hypothetical protein Bra3105_15370 [Brachybacterium halotolerans subsp. kimchii]|uniref:hypothetical protein n=1 Tax=Brachybacterium halotolerans TaxID=2795215 RepID=UPI001E57DE10|nr:hypothetical protein [Brachybacterium halotolerans]UEJ82203.1 hypothetical protein Bra3105_15370 [Brachybacterium halotolerans subsp. kimchii]
MTVPPPAYGPSSSYPSEPAYQAPPKKRGLKRIIFGALGIVANLIGLVVMPIIALGIVAVAMVSNVEATSLGSSSASMESSGGVSMYYVFVPTEEASDARCSVSSPGGSSLEEQSSSEGMEATVDGTSYTSVGLFTSQSAETITITCDGASDVAVADVGLTGVLVGLGVGFGIPILLGIIALILLIWGIVARVRSSRQIREHMQQHQQFQGYPQY